jgi:UDP-N-acetylglucosamine 2-epimerase (non-hydrolysing)
MSQTPGKILRTVMTLFGTRPEIIKLAPVIRQLDLYPKRFRVVNISSGQHTDLLAPFVKLFGVRVDRNIEAMRTNQPLSQLFARVLNELDPILVQERPDMLLVQGDTTTAAAGALAAFHRQIPVGHVEAGLRTEDPLSPFPEETNRRLITRLARYHFAATKQNVRSLLAEGVPRYNIFLTGNPVVDALQQIGAVAQRSPSLENLLRSTVGLKRIALTTHRRESFGGVLEGNLRVLREFIENRPDTALIFPVHPNPAVREMATGILAGLERIHLVEPLGYADFIGLLGESWLIVSDSGGIQEEAPSLGKPLLVLRESTERPEAIDSGIARLAPTPVALAALLEDAYSEGSLSPKRVTNPFGRGDSGQRIVRSIRRIFRAAVPVSDRSV